MGLRVVGSGLGRTGTKSLKDALELLLGAPCYHMVECFQHPEHPSRWHAGIRGEAVDWHQLLDGYAAAVDWPAAACWKELAEAFPDAIVLHSERPAEAWFRSADRTILEGFKKPREQWPAPGEDAWWDMAIAMFDRFTPDFLDRDAVIAAVDAWNADVRATAPADRLVIWQTGDGWEPICEALGLPVPDEPFPHVNTTAQFREHAGLDDPGDQAGT
jgi:hypothetical protein